MSDELAKLDAIAQAELVRSGEVSAAELVDAAIERLERWNPSLNAVIHPALERARETVRSSSLASGPFRGVPFLMKDIGGEEAGQPLHAGMGFLKRAGWVATQDSYFTQKIAAGGLISLGRTNTPELALMPTSEPEAYGPTRSPWNTQHSAGGSSGGAAAAVAAGIVPAAHASDGGGSIRGPASMCALVGLKPTRGRNSFGPGAAALLDLVAGPMPGDPYFAAPPQQSFASALHEPGKPLRVGIMRAAPRGIDVHPEMVEAVERCARRLEALGHEVEDSHPDALNDPTSVAHYVITVEANVARALDAWGEKVGRAVEQSDVEPLTWELASRGREISAPQLLATVEAVHRFGRQLAEWWRGSFDLLLTPTQAAPPPRIGTLGSTPEEPLLGFVGSAPYGVFTLPFNLSGQPAISLPGGWTAGDENTPAGLPLGIQLVAPYGAERLLLRAAAELEQAEPWTDRLPPLFG